MAYSYHSRLAAGEKLPVFAPEEVRLDSAELRQQQLRQAEVRVAGSIAGVHVRHPSVLNVFIYMGGEEMGKEGRAGKGVRNERYGRKGKGSKDGWRERRQEEKEAIRVGA